MKKVIVLLTLVATASAYSQGLINFNNRVSSANLTAPITYKATAGNPRNDTVDTKISGTGTLVVGGLDWGGKYARAALYGGAAGTAEGALQILVPAVTFKSGSLAGLVDTTSTSRTVPGVDAGSPAVFQVRAWDTGGTTGIDSYEAATAQSQYYAGKSVLINIAQLGGGTFLTPNLGANTTATDGTAWGLQPFSITYVPEPSIIGLGILGAVAGLFVFRRRN